ncbi:MAG: hypothetical protein KJS92_00985 [Bacteroidetes bacterium]|nr:hypothetical protein [Bacteroidota bacterium]
MSRFRTLPGLLLGLSVYGSGNNLKAQNESDAIRYSTGYYFGTARSMGVGGAVSTLGADASSITLNPAALAQYRSSEFSGTLSFQNMSNKAEYINHITRDSRFNMNIPNLSLVIANQRYKNGKALTEGWTNFTVAFGVNRSHDFQTRTFFRDTNRSSSISDYFAELANGQLVNDFPSGSLQSIAWNGYAIDQVSGTNDKYESSLKGGSRYLKQEGILDTRGSIIDWHGSFGANYNNRLYLGLGLVYSNLSYIEDLSFTETDLKQDPTIKDLKKLEVVNNNTDRGGSVGARIGMIVRPTDQLRVGIGIQTPRSFHINKTYTYQVQSYFDPGSPNGNSPEPAFTDPANTYDYKVITPFKANAGATLLFGKAGFISADAEFVDYTTAKLKARDYGFLGENANIRLYYRQVLNVRVGGELVVDMYRFRLGYMNNPNPFANNVNIPYTRNLGFSAVTGGFGIREEKYFLDMALMLGKRADYYTPYFVQEGSGRQAYTVTNNYRNWNFLVTLGFRLE